MRRPGQVELRDALEASRKPGALTWLTLQEPTPEEFDAVRVEFDLHELAIEDAVTAHQRPKMELYGDSLFAVLKAARYPEARDEIDLAEVMVFLGDSYIISVRHGQTPVMDQARAQVDARPDLARLGPGAVFHALLDRVVDGYDAVVETLDQRVDALEDETFSRSPADAPQRIHRMRRQVIDFQRASSSLIPPLERLAEGHMPLVDERLSPYFRDVLDHLVRDEEAVRTFRELLIGVLEAHLALVSVRQNEDMRKISAWVAIAAVPTVIAGVYGMNFEHFPELEWTFGYPFALGLMLAICTTLYRAFRRSGWL